MFTQQESTGKVDILEKGKKQHGKWRTRQKLIFVIVLVAGEKGFNVQTQLDLSKVKMLLLSEALL